jgi:hypothetical protein
VAEGFTDTEALEKLLEDSRISEAHKDALRKALDRIKNPPVEAVEETQSQETGLETEVEGSPDNAEE